MRLNAGPVPARVDGRVKAGLLDLVDHAVQAGEQAAVRSSCMQSLIESTVLTGLAAR